MILRTMRASFGRLNAETLTLHEGLNIIEAPNESGKSTWCAFLRTMLYGVNTAERATKAGGLPDKTRYLPWSGAAQAGSLELDCAFGRLELTRTGRAGAPMGTCTVTDRDSGEKLAALGGKSPGDTLLGVPESVFRRSAFIERKNLAVDPNSELEKRIAALVSTGDERMSYSDAAERLKKEKNRRRSRSGGRIPQLEQEAERLSLALRRLESDAARLHTQEAAHDAARRETERLEAELAYVERFEAAEAGEKLARAQRELEAQQTETARLRASLHGVTEATVERARESLSAFEARERDAGQAETDLAQYAKPAEPQEKPVRRLPAYLAALAGILAVVSVFLGVPTLIGALAGGLLVLTGITLLLRATWRERENEAVRQRFVAQAEAYNRVRDKAEAARNLRDEAAGALEAALAPLLPGDTPRTKIRETEAALAALVYAQARCRDLERMVQERDTPLARRFAEVGADAQVPQAPARGRREVERALNSARARLAEAAEALALVRGEQKMLGDPLVLASDLARVRGELERLEAEYAAIELAEQALADASGELQGRFSPLVSETAAGYFARMTGGRYDRLSFDREMRFRARQSGEPAARDAQYLSDGTLDQLYLAVRLAVCELALPAGDPCPLVLDDALAAFDDVRAAEALALLESLAATRQILLFTCTSRERRLLEQRAGASS